MRRASGIVLGHSVARCSFMFRLTCPTRWRWIVSSCAISAAALGFTDHLRAELSKETVVGIVVVSIRANYAPIHSYRAKTKEVLLDPTVTEKTTTVIKSGNVRKKTTQAPRSEFVGDLAVSGGSCYFNISGDDDQLLVIRDGRAVQRSFSKGLHQGRYIPENFGWFGNYDLREQGLMRRAERLGSLLTDSYIDSATLETMPDGNVVAKIKIVRPEGNWITIEADGAQLLALANLLWRSRQDRRKGDFGI